MGLLVGLLLYGKQQLEYYKQQVIPTQFKQNEYCRDTKTQTAWVAYRNGEYRCFLEYNEYPHRARGVYLENPEDISTSGL